MNSIFLVSWDDGVLWNGGLEFLILPDGFVQAARVGRCGRLGSVVAAQSRHKSEISPKDILFCTFW